MYLCEKMENSDSESESDCAVSTITSGLEIVGGQASNRVLSLS